MLPKVWWNVHFLLIINLNFSQHLGNICWPNVDLMLKNQFSVKIRCVLKKIHVIQTRNGGERKNWKSVKKMKILNFALFRPKKREKLPKIAFFSKSSSARSRGLNYSNYMIFFFKTHLIFTENWFFNIWSTDVA